MPLNLLVGLGVAMNHYWDQYPTVNKDLEKVEELLFQSIKCRDKGIEKALSSMLVTGGKMLRPAFLLLSARFGKFKQDKLYPLAAVVELLHMATLVHDDIIDAAELRRGHPTLQAEYGSAQAVFTGDLLFTKCFSILSTKSSMENMKLISDVIAKICEGEIEQFSAHYRIEGTVRQYLRRIATKTSALFAMSFYIGASEAKCSKKLCQQLGRIGYNIGMAFQIIDDILDYTGAEELVGKPLGSDLKQGIITLPLIYGIRTGDEVLLTLLEATSAATVTEAAATAVTTGMVMSTAMSQETKTVMPAGAGTETKTVVSVASTAPSRYDEDRIGQIISRAIELGGRDKARDLAKRYTRRAFDSIALLPACESRTILKEVTEKLLVREY